MAQQETHQRPQQAQDRGHQGIVRWAFHSNGYGVMRGHAFDAQGVYRVS